jgi:SAM-dependent methyltransferase
MIQVAPPAPYTLKASPYSSHSVMLRTLPQHGEGRRVLDLGCSSGFLSSILVDRGFQVVGVDVPGAPRDRFPADARFIAADLDEGLPALAGEFDYVLCGDLLEHLKHPLRLLQDVRTILAPGGVLVTSLPNSGHLYFRLNVLAGRFPAHDSGLFDRTHLHFYTWTGWSELFDRAGFQMSVVYPTATPFVLAFPQMGARLPLAMEAVSHHLARVWKKLFAYQFVAVAEVAQ